MVPNIDELEAKTSQCGEACSAHVLAGAFS